jgi:hypothetical protein
MNTVTGTIIIRGVEVEIVSEVDIRWQDDSFDHEFGVEHCGHAEVEHVYPAELDCDVREYALRELCARGAQPHRKRLRKLCLHIRRDIGRKDPDSFWPQKQLDKAVEGWKPDEPDYDDRGD